MNTPFLGILMIVGTFGLIALATVVLVYARLKNKPLPIKPILLVGAAWAALYVIALTASSLTSEERVLGLNEEKQFCGFYIDCHMQVAVTRVDTSSQLGAARTYVVTLRVSSTAVRVPLRLLDPRVVVRDARGRQFTRSQAAESLLAAKGAPFEPLTREIGPAQSFQTTVAFELPADVTEPRLLVTEGIWADKIIELFLIGDEDSLLHKRTAFELTT
jgi:hypothetical protein